MTDPDLAVAAEVPTEFEAAALVAVLKEAGIDAVVSRNAPSWTGQMSISPTATGASVLVRDEDLERAELLSVRDESQGPAERAPPELGSPARDFVRSGGLTPEHLPHVRHREGRQMQWHGARADGGRQPAGLTARENETS